MAGLIRLTWRDRNGNEDGHRVYRTQGNFDLSAMPAPIADLGADVTTYEDTDVIEGEVYQYIISAYRDGVEKFSSVHAAAAGAPNSPGSSVFIGGDMTNGFLGEVSTADLISGDDLASQIGLTAGTSQHSNEPWLKFAIDDEIIYVAKKPYRNDVSWDDINAVNAVYNDMNAPIVEKDGYQFRVTLMTGAEADPTVDENGEGSEWNRLMYRVHQDDPSGDPWVSYSNSDIVVGSGYGRATWVQETSASDTSRRVYRGTSSLVHFNTGASGYSGSANGWRPALRLVV